MNTLSLEDISSIMRHIDICMLVTKTATKALESRPMSNNRQVEYDGDSYFFTDGRCSAAQEIAADPEVNLSYVHRPALGKDIYISITGRAELIRDKSEMEKHWVKDLALWFEDGIDTPGLTMIRVRASRIHYWQGMKEGEIALTTTAFALA